MLEKVSSYLYRSRTTSIGRENLQCECLLTGGPRMVATGGELPREP